MNYLSINPNTKSPSFTQFHRIYLEELSEKAPLVVQAIKKQIGEGVIQKEYVCKGKKNVQDVFIGYKSKLPNDASSPIVEIQIATGGDALLIDNEGAIFALARIEQIDTPLINTAKTILENLGIDSNKYIKTAEDTLNQNLGFVRHVDYPSNEQHIRTYIAEWTRYKKTGDTFQYMGIDRDRGL